MVCLLFVIQSQCYFCLIIIQMKVSTQPYIKTYIFPVFSLGTLLRIVFLVLAVVLPFFITYSTPNFFLASHLQVNSTQSVTYNYNYHVTITTNNGLFTYTNLYQAVSDRPPIITQTDSSSVMQFGIKWPISPAQTILNVQVNLFFNFVLNGVTHFGSAFASAQGYSLGQVSINGPLSIVKGTGSKTMTSNSLTLLGYDPVAFFNSATQSSGYLKYDYSVSAVNLPTDVLQVHMNLNYGSFLATQQTASILGQLIWSWAQYFPIFLSLYWLLDTVFSFLCRQQILKRKIHHDPDYLQIIEQQNERRERLRLR